MTRGAPGETRARRIQREGKRDVEMTTMATAAEKERWKESAQTVGMSLSEYTRWTNDVVGRMLAEGGTVSRSLAEEVVAALVDQAGVQQRIANDTFSLAEQIARFWQVIDREEVANDYEG